jgi:hypothetical protein
VMESAGDPRSAAHLALLFELGRGVAKDPRTAMFWRARSLAGPPTRAPAPLSIPEDDAELIGLR